MLGIVAAGALAGYVGSRRLRVVTARSARSPICRRGSTGCASRSSPTCTSARTRRARTCGAIVDGGAGRAAGPDRHHRRSGGRLPARRRASSRARSARCARRSACSPSPATMTSMPAGPRCAPGSRRWACTVLVNERAAARAQRGERFWLAGTGDPAGIGRPLNAGGDAAPDIARTLAQRAARRLHDRARAQPGAVAARSPSAACALTLSGHTHHGQVSIPRLALEPGVDVPRATRWASHRRGRLAALHQSRHELLGPAAAASARCPRSQW